MERMGEVTAVNGEMLEVTFCRPADCGKCHACGGSREQMSVMVRGEAQLGDAAVVDMPVKTVLKASALAYALPCAGLLLGLVLGALLAPDSDLLGAVLALVCMGAALAFVTIREKGRREDARWQPKIVSIVPGGGASIRAKEEE